MNRVVFVIRPLLAAILAVALVVFGHAQSAPPFEELLDIARVELQETRTPGAAVALIDGDRVIFNGAVGVADVETGAAMRPDMLFRLGSTTKMFTAAALVWLAVDGRVSLDAPIGSAVSGLDPAIARLTPHQLLSHTAGVRDEAPMFGRHDDEALASGIRAMKATMLFAEPQAIYSYSNPGYWMSGLVVEQVVGKPFADAMHERLFAPLGMTRTTFRPTMAMTYPLAQGHEAPGRQSPKVIRPAANNAASWPAGSMFSNVHDLSRFVIAFMNEGRVDGRQVLDPRVIAKLGTAHVKIPDGNASYGYGLQISERAGVQIVSHGGSRAGYGSTIMMVPSRRVGAIVLGNRTGSGLPTTTRRGIEMLLRAAEGKLEVPRPDQTATPADRAALEAWAGRYTQGRESDIEFVVTAQAILVREGGQDRQATLQSRLRLAVAGNDAAAPPTAMVLVPDRDGRPAFIFRGGRSFRRVP
ncbi:MAG: serine hydrolase domain-containing protein [Acidobacteriota bacterium]